MDGYNNRKNAFADNPMKNPNAVSGEGLEEEYAKYNIGATRRKRHDVVPYDYKNDPYVQNFTTNMAKEIPEEKDDFRDKDYHRERRGGCLNTGCGCRGMINFGCLAIVILIIATIFVIVTKPASIWNVAVDFLNAGVEMPEVSQVSADTAKSEVNDQITSVGTNKVELREEVLTTLAREKLPQLVNLVADIDKDQINLYWEMDKTIENNPLIGVIEIRKSDGDKLVINKMGTQRIGTPEFLNKTVFNTILSVLNDGVTGNENYQLIYNLLAPERNVKIENLQIEDNKIEMDVNVNANLF